MKLPICVFDAKNAILCPKCESKLESGKTSKAEVEISGKWTPRFPIDFDKAIQIVKNLRDHDIEIEFEDSRRQKY